MCNYSIKLFNEALWKQDHWIYKFAQGKVKDPIKRCNNSIKLEQPFKTWYRYSQRDLHRWAPPWARPAGWSHHFSISPNWGRRAAGCRSCRWRPTAAVSGPPGAHTFQYNTSCQVYFLPLPQPGDLSALSSPITSWSWKQVKENLVKP